MKAFSPDQVKTAQIELIPDSVIRVVNTILTTRFNGKVASMSEQEILTELVDSENTAESIKQKGWLNFSKLYEKEGWQVKLNNGTYEFKPIPKSIM